jgi:hypothetical protein
VLRDPCLASDVTPPTVIVLEVDDTEDRVHGHQEHARSEAYDGGACFMPLPLSAGRSGRLRTTRLTATRCPGAQRLSGLQRLGKRRRHAWPETLVMVRGDSHVASPEGRPWIDAHPALRSVTGVTSNAV